MPRSDFHDITTGSNGQLPRPGYDLASGLGSPKADLLIPDLVAYNGSTTFTVAPRVGATLGKFSSDVTFSMLPLDRAATRFSGTTQTFALQTQRELNQVMNVGFNHNDLERTTAVTARSLPQPAAPEYPTARTELSSPIAKSKTQHDPTHADDSSASNLRRASFQAIDGFFYRLLVL